MFKKLLVFILSFIALFSFSGCLVVPQDGTDNGTNIEEMFSGLMFTLYERGEDFFVPVTSATFGDENCIAVYIEYTNKNGEKWFTSAASGEKYLNADGHNETVGEVDDGNVMRISSVGNVIYFNSARFSTDVVFSMDEISRNKTGDIVRDEGTVISIPASGISEYTATNEVKQSVTFTQTVNGKSEEKTETYSLSVTLTLKMREVGTNWRIVQNSDDGQMLENTSVTKDDAGDFEIKSDCAFVIAEEELASGEVKRTLCERQDGKWNDIEFLFDGGFGILENSTFKLIEEERIA